VSKLAALYEFSERLSGARSLSDIYEAGLGAVIDALDCRRAAILLSDNFDRMRFVAWRGMSGAYRAVADGYSPWPAHDPDPKSIFIADTDGVEFSDAVRAVLAADNARALAFIPLMARGRLIGKVVAHYESPRRFTDEDAAIGHAVARYLGYAIAANRAEAALRDREAMLEVIIDRTAFMITRCSRDHIMQFASRAYAEMLGLRSEDLIGRPLVEVMGETAYRAVLPDIERVLRGERVEYERPVAYRKIGPRIVRAILTPDADEDGAVRGWFGSLLDVTERAQAEARVAALNTQLEAEVDTRTRERDRIWNVSEDLLGVSNFEGYFVSVNPAWSKTLGWSEAEISSRHVSELRHPDDAAHSLAAREQLARGVPTVRMENRLRHKDGSWRWIAWTMTADKGLIYIAGRHVTAEKEAAAALQRAHAQLASAQKMEALGQLTGGVAHDFNNLMMIVGGYAQNMKKRATDARDIRAIKAIGDAVARGESLTRQLLAFSRRQPLNPTVVHPADAVAAIRDVLSGSTSVNIELIIDIPGPTWPICVDRSEFGLALVNIAINARDSMPRGGRLTIAAENVSLDAGDLPEGLSGDFVALRIGDTGCGIPADVLPRVFEPFFTTKAADKGTGLGLSQVYGFARRSGGTVFIDSEVERGTVVTVYLPRSGEAVPAEPKEQGTQSAGGEETILVVEDNSDVRGVAVSLLEELGYHTVEADSAPAALEKLAAGQHIDLVFTDVVLPGAIDGLALAQRISVNYPELPVVLTTGYARRLDAEPSYAVLRKPYDITTLGRAIREAMDARA
jgi:PAS domain S-box-containing protein